MIDLNKTSAKIIAFPTRGAFSSLKKWGKRHNSIGKTFSVELASAFISTLIQNDTQAAQQLIKEHGSQLATLHGNYFSLPLLIAANHRNQNMINLLLENGACLYTAKHDMRFKYLNSKMKSYFNNMLRFRQDIWESI